MLLPGPSTLGFHARCIPHVRATQASVWPHHVILIFDAGACEIHNEVRNCEKFTKGHHRMDKYTQARCRIATNAALLACLRKHPASPQDKTYVTDGGGGAFSLRREIQLSGDFAFISSTKDDSNRVTAVCTEVDDDGAGLTVRLAANTGCSTNVVQELQAVANIMMRASRHGLY